LVESLGQEFDTSKIESPLLQSIFASGLAEAYPIGDIEVDFTTIKAGKGIHIVGSMTCGTHFYTTPIVRNAAHASRIADTLVGLPVRKPLHIAIFVGTDLFFHLIVNLLVPRLLALGHFPFIFNGCDPKHSKHLFALQELSFFERTLLLEHIIPFIEPNRHENVACLTIEQMKAKFGIMIETVKNVNTLLFLQIIKEHYIDIGISILCYQNFGPRLISYFNEPGKRRIFLNPS
jgi:hypothetical protein